MNVVKLLEDVTTDRWMNDYRMRSLRADSIALFVRDLRRATPLLDFLKQQAVVQGLDNRAYFSPREGRPSILLQGIYGRVPAALQHWLRHGTHEQSKPADEFTSYSY